MKLEDYKNKVKSLKARHKKELTEFALKYAFLNSPIKIGDIVTDHIGSIIVEKYALGFSDISIEPKCVYTGTCYTKKGKPYKSGEKRCVHQSNIKKINGCEILH